MDIPKKNVAASHRSCNIPVVLYVRPIYGKPSATLSLQQSRCKIYDGTPPDRIPNPRMGGKGWQVTSPELQKTVACVCAIITCTEGVFKAREFPSGCWHCMYGYINYCIATQPADYNNYLISKVCVYYLKTIPDATYRYQMIEIHTQRDGMWFTYAPKICYNNCNYGNSNIICCSQVSVRIIYYLCITKKCNDVHGFTEITNARRRGRSVWMR